MLARARYPRQLGEHSLGLKLGSPALNTIERKTAEIRETQKETANENQTNPDTENNIERTAMQLDTKQTRASNNAAKTLK